MVKSEAVFLAIAGALVAGQFALGSFALTHDAPLSWITASDSLSTPTFMILILLVVGHKRGERLNTVVSRD